jgi:hypothetical protein
MMKLTTSWERRHWYLAGVGLEQVCRARDD